MTGSVVFWFFAGAVLGAVMGTAAAALWTAAGRALSGPCEGCGDIGNFNLPDPEAFSQTEAFARWAAAERRRLTGAADRGRGGEEAPR